MDRILARCSNPACTAAYRVPATHLGKKAKCKACGQWFVIEAMARPPEDPQGQDVEEAVAAESMPTAAAAAAPQSPADAAPAAPPEAAPAEAPEVTAELEKCWFCQENPGQESTGFRQALHNKKTGRKRIIRVPRCWACRSNHWAGRAGFIIGASSGLIATISFMIQEVTAEGVAAGVVMTLLFGATGYWLRRRPVVLWIVLSVIGGSSLAAFCEAIFGRVSPVLAHILAFVVWVGVTVGGCTMGYRRGRKVAAARAAVQTSRLKFALAYPAISELLERGWELGVGPDMPELLPWQTKASNTVELYAKYTPQYCPVCGTDTGKKTFFGNLASAFTLRPYRPVVCDVCGAHGCTKCCHFHDDHGRAATRTMMVGPVGQDLVYVGITWRHNHVCCDCGHPADDTGDSVLAQVPWV